MREKKQIILIMLILISIIGIACPQERDHSSHKVSELNLTVNLDKNEIHLNQGIQVDFIIKNKEKENDQKAYAKDVYLSASLSKSLAGPKEKLRIESNGTAGSIGTDGEVEISSDFNRHHPDSGDWAEIRPDRLISIHFPDLDPGEKIGIRYKTKYIKNLCQDPQPICYIPEKAFNWSIAKQNIQGPFIPKIKGLNYKPIIESFNVSIKPEYNITYPNATNCTIFEHSQIFFASKTCDLDDENKNASGLKYFDYKIDPYSTPIRINSGDYIDDSGMHQFQIEASDLIESNSINNSTYFRVIDLVSYHRSLTVDLVMYVILFTSLVAFFYRFLRESNQIQDRTKLTGSLIFIIFVIHIGLYLYYNPSVGYYKSLVLLESAASINAFLLFLFYISCEGASCKPINNLDLAIAVFSISLTITLFHYILPEILSQPIVYIALIIALLISLQFVLKIKDKIAPNSQKNSAKSGLSSANPTLEDVGIDASEATISFSYTDTANPTLEDVGIDRKKHADSCGSNSRLSIIGIIAVELIVASCAIYLTMPLKFESRFEVLDLLIIESMEVSLILIVLVEGGLYSDRLAEKLESVKITLVQKLLSVL